MAIIDEIKNRAKQEKKIIVLPEVEDVRVLEAAVRAEDEGIADVVLVGDFENAERIAKENDIDISSVSFVDIKSAKNASEYAEKLYDLRKHKGMTIEEANEYMKEPVYYGMMMVKCGEADGLVSGAAHSTADTLRPALQIIRTRDGEKLVSAFFLMEVPDCEYGENGVFIFADCGLNENPTSEELAEIACSSARSFERLVQKEAVVGMLSYSTHGSKISDMTEKMKNATQILNEKAPQIKADGEIQLDVAIVPEIAKMKSSKCKVGGKCNTLIFPDLNAGNIGYKLVRNLAKAEAYGPICQGMAKPVNDLSRSCSVDDIIGVIAITAVQAEKDY